MATIELTSGGFELLVKSQIILEARHNRAIDSGELIELLLMKLLIKLEQHGEDDQPAPAKREGKDSRGWNHKASTERAGGNPDPQPGTSKSIRMEGERRSFNFYQTSEN